ncbi:MAG TPA: cytochrome c oxidase subunit 3 [Bryobacteraceae bacterium]
MTSQRTIDVSHLRPYEISSEAPLWWGQAFLALIEGTMFSILIAMYFYIRLSMDMWPPPGIQLPPQLLPAICTILLIASCLGSYIASEAAKRDDRMGMILGLGLNLALAGTAMLFRAISWRQWNFKWTSTAYGSITWAILFLHTVDVAADLVFTLVLTLILITGKHGPRQRLGVHVDSIVWYFLVAIWIPLYVTVFWGPQIVGAPR